MRNVPGIYLIKCSPPGRLPIYYVGQSLRMSRRWGQHCSALRNGKHYNDKMQRHWSSYGPGSFSFEILEACPPDELDDRELWWLEWLAGHARSFNFGTHPAASMRGVKFSAEHRKKISVAISGDRHYAFGSALAPEHRESISRGGRGQKRSYETRQRISIATRAEKNAMFGKCGRLSVRSRPVEGVCLETGVTVRYESANMARSGGFDQGAISRVCHGKSKSHKGLRWRYV